MKWQVIPVYLPLHTLSENLVNNLIFEEKIVYDSLFLSSLEEGKSNIVEQFL